MAEHSDYSKFRELVLKLHNNRNHKITGSFGVYDAYKYIRKNKWLNLPSPVTEHEFYSIIRTVNSLFAENLLLGNDVEFPCRMGKLEVRKYNPRIKFADGKLLTTLPINWDKTLKLWFEDRRSYDRRLLIYDTPKEIFRVLYTTFKANYNNKGFYEFTLNRDLKLQLKNKIKEGALDAFILK